MKATVTQLAGNPDLITGIYNYCDRWCERCPATKRCLVYIAEQENETSGERPTDLENAAFWQELETELKDARQLFQQWAKAADSPTLPPKTNKEPKDHPLYTAGKQYAVAAAGWFGNYDHEANEPTNRSRDVIEWYQYQIAVKTVRALSARDSDDPDALVDADGAGKVALIGIDRSLAAWRRILLQHADHADSIIPLIVQLVRLEQDIEGEFPNARGFVRPGLDGEAL